jgi:predicted DNA-binding transcriptional regulator AlpA
MNRVKEDYIHVNEAVKVYNKTRQTFYNYINKGLVNSKKVHNKLYLKIEDIEKVL